MSTKPAAAQFAAVKRELEAQKLDSVAFAELCADECDAYVALLDANVSLPSKEALSDLEGIVKYLRIASAPPLLLAGFRCLSGNDFEKLLKAILTTHIRYVVVTNQNPLDVESRFYEAARLVRDLAAQGKGSAQQLSSAKAKLKELAVVDQTLFQASGELTLDRSEAVWLMARLANKMQSATKEIGMDKANLEHVFPQNPTTASWPNASALEELTWNIGNLTILGERLNRQAQNKSFADKKSQCFAKSEIEMTKRLLNYSAWTEKEIRARAGELIKNLAELWPSL